MSDRKFYLTKEGLSNLKKEYQDFLKMRDVKMKGEVPVILHSEDVNPEYLSFQEDLNLLEARIAELEEVLKNYELIKIPPKSKQHIVDLGAIVTVESDGDKDEFHIVGSLEANPALGKISNESPVGRALLGSRVGHIITIQSTIPITYKILKIKYKN